MIAEVLVTFHTVGYNQTFTTDQQNLKSKDLENKGFDEFYFGSIISKDSDSRILQQSSNKKQAFEQAIKTSFGSFIYQDSAFGNFLLPVIPRIPPPEGQSEPPIMELD